MHKTLLADEPYFVPCLVWFLVLAVVICLMVELVDWGLELVEQAFDDPAEDGQ